MFNAKSLSAVVLFASVCLAMLTAGCEDQKAGVEPGASVSLGGEPGKPAPLPEKALIKFDALKPVTTRPVNPPVKAMPEQAAKELTEARALLKANQTVEAISKIERAKDFAQDNPEILRALGMAYVSMGERARAADALRKAVKGAPDDFEAQLILSQLLANDRQYDQAIVHLRTALMCSEAKPEKAIVAETLKRLASWLQNAEYWTAALDCYTKLADWIDQYGSNYTQSKELTDWTVHPEKLQIVRGQLLLDLRKFAEAQPLLQKGYEANRGDLAAAKLLVQAMIGTKDFKKAEALMVEMARDASQGAQLSRLATQLCLAAKDPGMPKRIWDTFLTKEMMDPFLAASLARISERLGQGDQGIAILRAVVDKMPGNTRAANVLAGIYARKGDGQRALAVLAKVIEGDQMKVYAIEDGLRQIAASPVATPQFIKDTGARYAASQPAATTKASDRYAWLYLAGKLAFLKLDNATAKDLLGKAIDARKDFLPAYEGIVDVYLAQDKPADTAGTIAEVSAPFFASYLKGKVAMARRQVNEATRFLEEAQKANGKFVPAMLLLADLYTARGDASKTQSVLEAAVAAEPDGTAAVRRLFDFFIESRRNQEAYDLLGTVMRRQAQNIDVQIMLVQFLMARAASRSVGDPMAAAGDRATAALLAQQLLDQEPDNIEVNMLSAQVAVNSNPGLLSKAQFENVSKRMESVIKMDERNVTARKAQASLLDQIDRNVEAAAVWKKLYEQNPSNLEFGWRYATQLMLAGKAAEAMPVVEKLLTANTDDVMIRNLAVAGRVKLKQYAKAAAELLEWYKQDTGKEPGRLPRLQDRYVSVARVSEDDKLREEAIKTLETWIPKESNNPERLAMLQFNRLGLMLLRKQYDTAAEFAGELMKKNPKSAMPQRLVVSSLVEDKQYDKAIGLLDKWITAAGSEKDVVSALKADKIGALYAAGKADQAKALTTEWIKSEPNSVLPRLALLSAMDEAKGSELALAQVEQWLGELSKPTAATGPSTKPTTRPTSGPAAPNTPEALREVLRLEQLRLVMSMRNYDRGLKLVNQYLAQEPDDTILLRQKSSIQAELKQHQAAIETLEKVMSLTKGEPSVGDLNNLGYFYAESGVNLDKAETMLRKAVQRRPGDPTIIDSLAWAYYRQGKFGQAAELFRGILDDVKDDPEAAMSSVIYDHAGDSYYRLGWADKAIQYWAMAVEQAKKEKKPAEDDKQVLSKTPGKIAAVKAGKAPAVAEIIAPVDGK